jgi:hypothetical protein
LDYAPRPLACVEPRPGYRQTGSIGSPARRAPRQVEIEHLILEVLECETLAARFSKGPLPLDQIFDLDPRPTRGVVSPSTEVARGPEGRRGFVAQRHSRMLGGGVGWGWKRLFPLTVPFQAAATDETSVVRRGEECLGGRTD